MKTSTTASRQPFRTASSPSHRFPTPRTLTRRAVTAARACSSHPPELPDTPQGQTEDTPPSARQTQRAEISPRRRTERVYRDASARRGQHTTATRAVRASGAFALVSLHFRYVRNFLSASSTLRVTWEVSEGASGTFWSERAGSSSSFGSRASGRVQSGEKSSLSTKTPHQQTRPSSSC